MISISASGRSPGDLLAERLAHAPAPHRALAAGLGRFPPSRAIDVGKAVIPAAATDAGCLLVVSGVAGEVRALAGGRRQILRLRLPGDVLYPGRQEVMVALTRTRVVDAGPFLEILERPESRGGLRRAWLSLGLADQDQFRDHIVRLGRMTAAERVAHILLETHDRLGRVGLATRESAHLPLTQESLSDLVGLSIVHLSRTLQGLRREGYLHYQGGLVAFLDRARLAAFCAWSPVGGVKAFWPFGEGERLTGARLANGRSAGGARPLHA
jgi:CRP-like cAMP-binding protein